MADRYWVGGTAAWDATAGTKWALTNGGAGGQAVPTAADDVFFSSGSGTVTCTVTGARVAKSINCTGFTGTLAGASTPALTISGSMTLVAGMTLTYAGTTTFDGTGTLTSAGKTLGPVVINGSGITTTLGDSLTSSGSVTVTQGTLNANNNNITATALLSNNSNTRTITLGSSTVTLSASTAIDFTTNTNLTFNAGTSTIFCSAATTTVIGGAGTGTGVTFATVSFTSTTSSTYNIRSINTFTNLAVTAPTSAGVSQVTFDSRQTISGTLSTNGTAGNRRVWFRGVTYGIAQTLTINAAASLTDADFRDIYVIGTAAPISGTRIGDLRGCRGITFSAPKTVYWNLAGAQNWNANGWTDTPTGTPSTDFFPMAQDTATFTDSGSVTGTITMVSGLAAYAGTVDMSGRTSAMTLSISAGQTIYGDWKNGSGTTITTLNTLTFSGRNTQTIISAGKTFSGAITIDSYGGTVQLGDAISLPTTSALTITNGSFDTKGYNVTASSLVSTVTNVRSISLGASTLSLAGTTPISFATSTNLTFDAGTSQINSSATSTTSFQGGGMSFYDVSFTGTVVSNLYTIFGENTFNDLTFTAPASAGYMLFNFDSNQTVNGFLTCAGATAVRRISVASNVIGTTKTLTVGTLSATDCDFQDITIAGAAAGSSPTRAGDRGGNSGITFPAPKTVYWNLAGAQNWSATAWAPGSGGTPNINNFPLPQDTAVFDNAGAAGTVTVELDWVTGTVDFSNRTSAMTFTTSSNTLSVFGDWKFGTGVTNSSTNGEITFSGRGTEIITSNGVQFGCFVNVNSVSGTLQLADALSIGATKILTLASGTFDAVSYNVTTGQFSVTGSTTRTLKMGSGTWTLSGTASVWDATTITNLAFYKNTANIVLSDTSTTARTFRGGNLSYNKLTIGGTTGISTLNITGDNQFTELASTKTVAHTIGLENTTQTFGKWTVTGTVGNVVTLTGTGTSHILAGACTSGINYLAMGSIGFAATSPGEFYAGVNSTGTAAAPVYRTAKPADSTRYWVGGTGNWSSTARWSTASGGGSGASVPRSHDDVVFNAASNATSYTATVDAVTGGARMKSLTISGPASGSLTLAGTAAIAGIHNNITLPATGLTRDYTGAITLSGSATGRTITTNGVGLQSAITVNGVDCGFVLGSALDNSVAAINVNNGSFDTSTYNLTATNISSSTSHKRSVILGTGTHTLSGATPIDFGTTENARADLTVTANTSQINCTAGNITFSGNNQTLYNVSFTGTSAGQTITINGANTFNNLTFPGVTTVGLKTISITADQTVNGTLTFTAGTDATRRSFCRSSVFGTTRTITAAAVSMTDVDFRDITIAGAAAPASGTRIGDCKGNSGITFTAATTRYWNLAGGDNWSGTGWAASSGASPAANNFPLAQDTAVFEATGLNSGATITVDQSYNIGTINMAARTSNTMTLATGTTTPTIHGNWINGTGTTLSGTGLVTFSGRGAQTITSAGKTFTQPLSINSPSGTVTLQDAFTSSNNTSSALNPQAGTFSDGGYAFTLSGASSGVNTSNTGVRTINVGSTWTLGGTTGWNAGVSTNLTVTGTGTISLTSASAKTFAGGGVSYTNITVNQGGAGALTITGNNAFKDITNTYKATGAANITLGNTTQRVSQWTAAGEAGRLLTIQGTAASSPCTLIHTGTGNIDVDYLAITGVRAYPLS